MHLRNSASWLRAFVICQVWAFVLFAPSLGMITLPANRYFWCWSHEVLAIRLAAVAAAGLVLFGLGLLLRTLGPRGFDAVTGLAALGALGLVLWWGFPQLASDSLGGRVLQA